MDEATKDDTELEKLSEQEAAEQEGEDETSFTDDHQPGDESILIIDGSNPLFIRPDDEEKGETSKSYNNPLKEIVIKGNEQFVRDPFGISVGKDDGPSSTILYDELIVTKDGDRVDGAKYKGMKIIITNKKTKALEYSTNKKFQKRIGEFK